jgi:hypothetical protein
MAFARVYPWDLAKAKREGRSREELHVIIHWLTGYSETVLRQQIAAEVDLETFFAQAPQPHPNAAKITGLICGHRVGAIADPTLRQIRSLDKLVDELAKGKALDKILRK